MATIHEITEDWQREGLSPTWVKLQQAQAEFDALEAERNALADVVFYVEQAAHNGGLDYMTEAAYEGYVKFLKTREAIKGE